MKSDDPILTAFALGEIDDAGERERIERALASDPELRRAVDEIRATAERIDAALAAEAPPQAAAGQSARVKASDAQPERRLSPPARKARIAQLTREAPGLAGIGRDRNKKAPMAAYGAAMAACLALVGLTVFRHVTDQVENIRDGESDLVEVEPLDPEMLKFRSAAAEEIAAQIRAEQEAEAAREEALVRDLSAIDLVDGLEIADVETDTANESALGATGSLAASRIAIDLPEVPVAYELPEGVQVADRTADVDSASTTGIPGGMSLAANAEAARAPGRAFELASETAAPSVAASEARERGQAAESFEMHSFIAARVDGFEAAIGERFSRENYDFVQESGFVSPRTEPLSTFSIDVDTTSYTNVRRMLAEGRRPPAGAVRIEELVNYFSYEQAAPGDPDSPFSVATEIAEAPWAQDHRLVRVALKGYEMAWEDRPPSNLVFLVDVSGSMETPNKLPLVKRALGKLINRLDRRDRVAIVTYAGQSEVALPSTTADNRETLLHAIERLQAGGSTAGEAGIMDAYRIARENFRPDGNNRVILCTDGDFNVGLTSRSDLVELVQDEAGSGVQLTVFGFGGGNFNDGLLEELTNRGNGTYAYIDEEREADRLFGERAAGTLLTIAKDVKIQVEFNPLHVQAYRLIGYENRALATDDFADDRKDAGELGAGHHVTALYEIIPAGVEWKQPDAPDLRYQRVEEATSGRAREELLVVKLRYKLPDEDKSHLLEHALAAGQPVPAWRQASDDFRWAAAVAGFGMILRDSEFRGGTDWNLVERLARSAVGPDPEGDRREFLQMIALARQQHGQPRRTRGS